MKGYNRNKVHAALKVHVLRDKKAEGKKSVALRALLENIGEVNVGASALVLLPVIAILPSALFEVTLGTVQDHAEEEYGVEVRQRRVEACDKCPAEILDEIGSVVSLASILEPSISEEKRARLGLDIVRVLNDSVR